MLLQGRRGLLFLLALLVLFVATFTKVKAFTLNGHRWAEGTDIVMHLSLTRPAVPLQDGSASWNASAADALSIWNQQIALVQFSVGNPVPLAARDNANTVAFSRSIYDESFPARVLAVTIYLPADTGTQFTETDVIFNDALQWDSYRGPQQGYSANATYDLRRVALHEFGHVLGLDHPDDHGQSVNAIMNSQIGSLDSLAADDIEGARSLYVRAPVEIFTGNAVSYQVSSNIAGEVFSASNLPPGLTIDSGSGLISGVATISGQYRVRVTITSQSGTRTAIIDFNVTAPPNSLTAAAGSLLKTLPLEVGQLVADPVRYRVYATLPSSNSVAIIDSLTLSVIKTIPAGSSPFGLSISADGSKLWVANRAFTNPSVSVIDLDNLQPLSGVAGPQAAFDVVEGLAGRLYLSSSITSGSLVQIDSHTGALQGVLAGPFSSDPGFLRVTADRRTLFYASQGGGRLQQYDISGPTAVLVQNRYTSESGKDLALSHDGRYLVFAVGLGNLGYPNYSTARFETADLGRPALNCQVGAYPGQAIFSGDDTILYQGVDNQGKMALIDTSTFTLSKTLVLAPGNTGATVPPASDIAIDRTGSALFYASFAPDLRIFATGRVDFNAPVTTLPKSLLNVSTRLRAQTGDDVLIGGFIITGHDPKKVVVRATGPSLPVNGKLADPQLELHGSDGALLFANDNWNEHRLDVLESGLMPNDEHESALAVTLAPGAYTAIVRGVGGTSGVGLVEVYDLSSDSNSRLANISTRGKVETGDNVMIGGFIIGGTQPTRAIVRALGPSLAANGVSSALSDTTLELYDAEGSRIALNDNWQSDQAAEIQASALAPTDPRESAILRTFVPGSYTAIVRGANNTTGVALVEVYNLEP